MRLTEREHSQKLPQWQRGKLNRSLTTRMTSQYVQLELSATLSRITDSAGKLSAALAHSASRKVQQGSIDTGSS